MSAGVSTRRSVTTPLTPGACRSSSETHHVAHLVGVRAVRDPLGEDVHRVVLKGGFEIRPSLSVPYFQQSKARSR